MISKYKTLYIKIIEPIIDKTSDFLKNHLFSKSEKCQNIAVKYFALTSKITHFFLFNFFGNLIYLIFFIFVFLTNGKNFTLIYYTTLAQGWSSFFSNFFHYLDWSFFSLLGFLSFLFELVFLNTVLVSIPEIKKKIGINYGENFVRDRGYNSILSSLVRTSEKGFGLALSVGAAFIGAAAGQIHETSSYEKNYDKYINAKIQNPSLEIKPPERGSLLKLPFLREFN